MITAPEAAGSGRLGVTAGYQRDDRVDKGLGILDVARLELDLPPRCTHTDRQLADPGAQPRRQRASESDSHATGPQGNDQDLAERAHLAWLRCGWRPGDRAAHQLRLVEQPVLKV